MSTDAEILQRLKALEIELQHERYDRLETEKAYKAEIAGLKAELVAAKAEMKAENAALEKKLSYYDKMALKWGGFCLGFLTFGAFLWAGVDKLKDKVLGWLP